jgi:hypothetical protein
VNAMNWLMDAGWRMENALRFRHPQTREQLSYHAPRGVWQWLRSDGSIVRLGDSLAGAVSRMAAKEKNRATV